MSMSATLLLKRSFSPMTTARYSSARLLLQRQLGGPLSRALGSNVIATDAFEPRSFHAGPAGFRATSSTRSMVFTSPASNMLIRKVVGRPGSGGSPLEMQLRCYTPGRNPWQNDGDWKSTLKTGALVVLGTGALIASTSVAFGLIIAGAAGYGVYTLYQKFFGPYQSSRYGGDPFAGVNSNIDALNEMFGRTSGGQRQDSARVSSSRNRSDELDSLVQGMPLVVRGLVKTIFSFVGKAMQGSMERAGELRRRTNEYLQANKRVRDQMGDDVSVSSPQQWMESTVNGVGRVEAMFPVSGAYGAARVTMKASVSAEGSLNFTELKYRNSQSGDVIDLLRDTSVGGRRKTVIDAEYVDLDDHNSRW